ncbi:hypothetical protein D3C86_1871220 [compost metagenome]
MRFTLPFTAAFAGLRRVQVQIVARAQSRAAAGFDVAGSEIDIVSGIDDEIAARADATSLIRHG